MFRNILACVFLLLPVSGLTEVTKFETVNEVIVFFDEFHEENNTYEQLGEDPKHIRLSPRVVEAESAENMQSAVQRAIMHGIFRVFVHTKINEIKITSVPVVLEFGKPKLDKFVVEYSRTLTVSRKQAEAALREMLGLALEDVVTDQDIGGTTFSDMWTKEFESIYYTDANRAVFFSLLEE